MYFLIEHIVETFVQILATSKRRDNERSNNVENDPQNDGDTSLNFGHDDENMVSSSRGLPAHGNAYEASNILLNRDRHLRYRTRVFAAEYVILFSIRTSDSFTCIPALIVLYACIYSVPNYFK